MKSDHRQRYFLDLLQNRRLLFCAIFVAILSYGFAITHYSIGVDDVARNYYFTATTRVICFIRADCCIFC